MIVDFHTHIFPDRMAPSVIDNLSRASGTLPYTDGTARGLLDSMEKSGITYSVTLPVATNPEKVVSLNRAAVPENGNKRLIRFGAMHPDCPDWKAELRRLATQGCKGIKIHPVYQGVCLDDVRYLRILEEAGALGLTVVTHTGDDIGFPGVIKCSPAMARHALCEVGPVKLVLAHMGGWHCWEEAAQQLADTSAMLDTSFSAGTVRLRNGADTAVPGLMDASQMRDMIRLFGADRILFGTDSPWTDQREAVEYLNALGLTGEENENILWKNAARLLSLSEFY